MAFPTPATSEHPSAFVWGHPHWGLVSPPDPQAPLQLPRADPMLLATGPSHRLTLTLWREGLGGHRFNELLFKNTSRALPAAHSLLGLPGPWGRRWGLVGPGAHRFHCAAWPALLSASRPCPTWTRLGPDSPSGLPTSLVCRTTPPRTPCSLMPLSVSLCSRGPPDGPADLPHLLIPKPPNACCVLGTWGRASPPQGQEAPRHSQQLAGPGPQRPQATPGAQMRGAGTRVKVDTPRDSPPVGSRSGPG